MRSNIMNQNSIQQLCQDLGIHPAKSRGQNFLIDRNITDKIIKAADIRKDDIILEVGPGFGVLTRELLKVAGRVIAVELDKKFYEYLKKEFNQEIISGQLQLVNGDILKVNLNELGLKNDNYKVVANLPYSITSSFLRNFTEKEPKPSEILVMIQAEVAQRIIAKPGEMSILAVAMQFFAIPEILFKISKNSFWPEPEVDSAMIKLKIRQDIDAKIPAKSLFQIVKIGFSAKRKQLHNNLAAGLHLKNEEIKKIFLDLGWREDIRAQDLGVGEWITLSQKVSNLSKNIKIVIPESAI